MDWLKGGLQLSKLYLSLILFKEIKSLTIDKIISISHNKKVAHRFNIKLESGIL